MLQVMKRVLVPLILTATVLLAPGLSMAQWYSAESDLTFPLELDVTINGTVNHFTIDDYESLVNFRSNLELISRAQAEDYGTRMTRIEAERQKAMERFRQLGAEIQEVSDQYIDDTRNTVIGQYGGTVAYAAKAASDAILATVGALGIGKPIEAGTKAIESAITLSYDFANLGIDLSQGNVDALGVGSTAADLGAALTDGPLGTGLEVAGSGLGFVSAAVECRQAIDTWKEMSQNQSLIDGNYTSEVDRLLERQQAVLGELAALKVEKMALESGLDESIDYVLEDLDSQFPEVADQVQAEWSGVSPDDVLNDVVDDPASTYEPSDEPYWDEPYYEPSDEPYWDEPYYEPSDEPYWDEPYYEPSDEPYWDEPYYEPSDEPYWDDGGWDDGGYDDGGWDDGGWDDGGWDDGGWDDGGWDDGGYDDGGWDDGGYDDGGWDDGGYDDGGYDDGGWDDGGYDDGGWDDGGYDDGGYDDGGWDDGGEPVDD